MGEVIHCFLYLLECAIKSSLFYLTKEFYFSQMRLMDAPHVLDFDEFNQRQLYVLVYVSVGIWMLHIPILTHGCSIVLDFDKFNQGQLYVLVCVSIGIWMLHMYRTLASLTECNCMC